VLGFIGVSSGTSPLQEAALAQGIMQPDVGDDVGFVPVLRMQPAFGHHALRREIDDHLRAEIADALDDLVRVMIEIELREMKAAGGGLRFLPLVRKKRRGQFRRSAAALDFQPLLEAIIDEGRRRIGIGPDDKDALFHETSPRPSTGESA
jgi:hypothetical protein